MQTCVVRGSLGFVLAGLMAACGQSATVDFAGRTGPAGGWSSIAPTGGYIRLAQDQPPALSQDSTITARIESALERDPVTSGAHIRVHTRSGTVQLSGFVKNAAQKIRAGQIAEDIAGVKAVENQLVVQARSGAAEGPFAGTRVFL